MERGSRVGRVVKDPPKSTIIDCLLNISHKIPLFSVTWSGITLKNVQLPVGSSIAL